MQIELNGAKPIGYVFSSQPLVPSPGIQLRMSYDEVGLVTGIRSYIRLQLMNKKGIGISKEPWPLSPKVRAMSSLGINIHAS